MPEAQQITTTHTQWRAKKDLQTEIRAQTGEPVRPLACASLIFLLGMGWQRFRFRLVSPRAGAHVWGKGARIPTETNRLPYPPSLFQTERAGEICLSLLLDASEADFDSWTTVSFSPQFGKKREKTCKTQSWLPSIHLRKMYAIYAHVTHTESMESILDVRS